MTFLRLFKSIEIMFYATIPPVYECIYLTCASATHGSVCSLMFELVSTVASLLHSHSRASVK